MKRLKRASSFLLALAMILSMIPAGILSATASAPTVGENVLHASYCLSGVNVNGAMDLASEPYYRRTISLGDGLKVSAVWNWTDLYLAFSDTTAPAVTQLHVNGQVVTAAGTAGATAREIQIPLASVGINTPSLTDGYTLSFQVGEVTWEGKLVFDTSTYATTAPSKAVNYGADPSADGWTVEVNNYESATATENNQRDLYCPAIASLASSLQAPTIVEMDVKVDYLPESHAVYGAATREFYLGALDIVVVDDVTITSNKAAEAMFTAICRTGEKVYLAYWDNAQSKYVEAEIGTYETGKTYHLRIEYSYTAGDGTTTDNNDVVAAKYFVNGKLVAETASAKRFSSSITTANPNTVCIQTQSLKTSHGEATEANSVKATVSNLSVVKPQTVVPGMGVKFLHASYAQEGADVDGLMDLVEKEPFYRRTISLGGALKVSAAWNWTDLYLAFADTAAPAVTDLKVNGQAVTAAGTAGATAREIQIPLASVGIGTPNVNEGYTLSFRVGEVTWEGKLIFDTSTYATTAPANSQAYGTAFSTDNWTAYMHVYNGTSEASNADVNKDTRWRDLYWPVMVNLASSGDAATIVEMDVTVNYLQDANEPAAGNGGKRDFLPGGLNITVIDDVTITNNTAAEGVPVGLYKNGTDLKLVYWDSVQGKYVSVVVDTYTAGKTYHLRLEYSYPGGTAGLTTNDNPDNDLVNARYFVNGKLVAVAKNVKRNGSYGVQNPNSIILITQNTTAEIKTEALSTDVTVANLSVVKSQPSVLTDKAAADAVDTQIGAIGTVTLDSETAIEAARAAYDGLTDTQKALVTKLSILEAAETKLDDLTAAKAVDDQIAAIGTVTLEKKGAIEAARAAYDALSDARKVLVTKLDVLTAAEAALAALEDQAAAKTVDDQIAAIGEVTLAKKTAIEAARAAYNALTADQKALVTNLSVLEAAETELAELQDAVDDIEEKIAAIGEVTIAKGLDIRNIKDDFDALTPEQQAAVENVAVLTAALNTLNELCEGVSHVIDLIDAIGTVTYTQASMDKIVAAENAYAALNQEQKSFVENVEDLEAARDAYNALKAAAEKEAADKAAAKAVQDKIDAIGTVTLEKKADIDVARAAYDGLTADQKALVTNVKTLTDAEAALKALQDATDKETVDKAAAKAVADKIAALGTVTLESKEAIEAARTAYDGLTADQKALVTNVKTLTDAEAALKALQDAAEKEAADKAAAKAVADKIAAIGTVTLEKKAAIEAARAAYDALTADQKAFVENYKTLTDAEAALKALQAAADKEAADKAAAKAAQDKIAAIGTVTLEKKAAIEAAEAAYKALTADQKALVTNYKTLIDARAAYDKLVADKEAADKEAADKAAAKAAQDKIAAIGTVTLEKKADIDVARAAYDALTAEQKALVTNVKTLTDAEAALKALQAAADKETVDKAAAKAVQDKIAAIGTVTLEKKAAIEAARTAYDGLTADQKALVTNVKTLTDAEAALKALQDAADKEAADKAAAKAVADKIAALGTVTLESKEAIEAARAAYDKLTAEQKALIGDVKALTDAEAALKSLQAAAEQETADKAAAEAVEKLIADIGDVTLESDEAIKAARAAYDKLTAAQKALVKNYKALADSETALKDLEDAQDAPSKTGDDTPLAAFVTIMVIGLLGVCAMLIPAVRRKLLGK